MKRKDWFNKGEFLLFIGRPPMDIAIGQNIFLGFIRFTEILIDMTLKFIGLGRIDSIYFHYFRSDPKLIILKLQLMKDKDLINFQMKI